MLACALPLGIAVTVSAADWVDATWRLAIVVIGLATTWRAWRVNNVSDVYALAIGMSAVRLALLDTERLTFGIRDLTWMQAAADLLIGPAMVAVLLLALRARRSTLGSADLLDGVVVASASGLMAWIVLANPAWRDGIDPLLAVAAASYLPIAVMLVTFAVELLLEGLTNNVAARLFAAGAVVNLVGTAVRSLVHAGMIPQEAMGAVAGLLIISYVLICAGLGHPDAHEILEPYSQRSTYPRRETLRLAPVGATLLPATVLTAAVRATSPTDSVVRTIAGVVLVLAVLARLFITLERSAAVHRRLVERLDRDDLTGLVTRQRFVGHVCEVLDATWRSEHHPTLIQINIDRFKNLNDTLGHDDANRLLMMVAERLSLTAEAFGGQVGRSGGDDFVIIDAGTRSAEDALERVEQVRDAFRRSFVIGNQSVFVTASLGVTLAPQHRSITAEEMMRRADIAVHRAKAEGRNRAQLFDDSMQSTLSQRMDVEHALHGAIGRREMHLYHQPIVDIVNGHLSGFEALIRWKRNGTIVSPADFIPIAEETGIISELGAWALEEALSELRRWIDEGIVPPTTTTSVNVSPIQITDPNFADIVSQALLRTDMPPHLLWIEMTESTMLEQPELARATLGKIRAMGVRLALDDFGTGYSSLSLLQQFPIQRIKIDRAFVQGLAEHNNDRTLVRTIIAMAKSMDLDLVAEGVETVAQLEALRDLGCDKAQGYLISRPVPSDALRSTMIALSELTDLALFGKPSELVVDRIACADDARELTPDRSGRWTEPALAFGIPLGGHLLTRPLA